MLDKDGEEPHPVLLEKLNLLAPDSDAAPTEGPTRLKLRSFRHHGYQVSDVVRFGDIKGMTQLNGVEGTVVKGV